MEGKQERLQIDVAPAIKILTEIIRVMADTIYYSLFKEN